MDRVNGDHFIKIVIWQELSLRRGYLPPLGATWFLYRVMLRFSSVPGSQPMEGNVSDVRHTSFGLPHPRDVDVPRDMDDRTSFPTPGEVIGQVARVVAVCLVLALLARVLVAFTGMQ